MHYRSLGKSGMAMLLGLCVLSSIAQADRPRSPVERRQQPNGGFWQKQSSVTKSFNTRSTLFPNARTFVSPQSIVRGPVISNGAVVRQYPNAGTAQPMIINPSPVYRVGSLNNTINQ